MQRYFRGAVESHRNYRRSGADRGISSHVMIFPRTRSHVACRVDEDVATLIPHRSGCAGFPLPVLHGRASLAVVKLSPSLTCRSRKSRRWPLVSFLPVQLSVVVSCTGLRDSKFSPVFPVNGSLLMAPLFPRSGPVEFGSPMSQVVLRCYDFPSRISGHLFVSLPGPTLPSSVRVSQLALALPEGRRVPSGPGSMFNRRPDCRFALTWT